MKNSEINKSGNPAFIVDASSVTGCYSFFFNEDRLAKGLDAYIESNERLNRYGQLLDNVRNCMKEKRFSCKFLAEAAYSAETDVRMLLKLGIDSLNDLIDSGIMTKNVISLSEKLSQSSEEFSFEYLLSKFEPKEKSSSSGILQKGLTYFKPSVAEIQNTLLKYKATFQYSKGNIMAGFHIDGKRKSFLINVNQGFGSGFRVSSSEFFSSVSGSLNKALTAIPFRETCHNTRPIVVKIQKPFDFYESSLGSFALQREIIYNHARKMEEIGFSTFNGNGWWQSVKDFFNNIDNDISSYLQDFIAGLKALTFTDYTKNIDNKSTDTDGQGDGGIGTGSEQLTVAAIILAGINCALLDGGCSLQNCQIIDIQA